MGLIKDGVCTNYSLRGVNSIVQLESDYLCRQLPGEFNIRLHQDSFGGVYLTPVCLRGRKELIGNEDFGRATWRHAMKSALRTTARWIVAIAMVWAFGYWLFGDRHQDYFTPEEVAHLNAGGEISTERFDGFDEICFFSPTLFRIMDNNCWHSSGALGLIKDGTCTTYSMRGVHSVIAAEYDYYCKPLPGEMNIRFNVKDKGVMYFTPR